MDTPDSTKCIKSETPAKIKKIQLMFGCEWARETEEDPPATLVTYAHPAHAIPSASTPGRKVGVAF